ncbi:MAG: hypothetical protein U0414_34755 [Polyangiaceae bacterium]
MFEPGEASACPVCGVKLERIEKLPKPKHLEEPLEPLPPDEETLPWLYWRRGRGPLLAVSVIGIISFMLPWIHEQAPEHMTRSGLDLARNLNWMWAPLIAWIVMIPLVASRRSIFRMRGARVAVGFLAAIGLVTSIVRVLTQPKSSGLILVKIDWGAGLYLNAAAALVALGLAWSFGGRIDVLTTKQHRRGDETLH